MKTLSLLPQTLAFAFCSTAIMPSVHGALNNQRWRTIQESAAAVGFDSNIYGSASDELADGFLALSHGITVGRKNSLTRMDLSGNVASTWYLSEHDANILDGGLAFNAGYPNDSEDVSFWKAAAYWRTQHEIDYRVAQRLQTVSYGTSISGEWLSSPKLGFTGNIEARVKDRTKAGYNTFRNLRAGLGISHAWRPERRWNAEYALELGETEPRASRSDKTTSVSHILGIRARGRLLPKVTGDAFVGIRNSTFSGAYNFSDTGPTALVNITYKASAQLTANIGAFRHYQFSANGDATQYTALTFDMKRNFARGFSITATVSPAINSYSYADGTRRDQIWTLAAAVDYARTNRFHAGFSTTWFSNHSDESGYNASRALVRFYSGLRF